MEKILEAINKLDTKIESSISKLNLKIDDSIGKLDSKIDTSISALNLKIDTSINTLDAKIDTSINALNSKIDDSIGKLDSKIDNLDEKFDKRFDQVDARFDQQDDLINIVAVQVSQNTNKIGNLENLYWQHDQRLERFEKTMATKDDIRGIHKTLDWLVAKFTKFEHELLLLAHRSAIHTDQITVLQNTR